MSLVVKCTGCGKPTPAGKLLCIHCGTKLKGITAAELQSAGKKTKAPVGERMGGFFAALMRVVVTLALFGLVGLIVWPAQPTAELPESDEAVEAAATRVQNSLTALDDALNANRSQMAAFTEPEINAFLLKLIEQNEGIVDSSGSTMGVSGVTTAINANRLTTLLVSTIGPVDLTWELTYRLESNGRRVRAHTDSARLGHLPMPLVFGDFVSGKISSFFRELDQERRIWNSISALRVEDDSVKIKVGGN